MRRRTPISVTFEDPETKAAFIKDIGADWERFVIQQLTQQPGGQYKVVCADALPDLEALGCISLGEREEFILLPFSGDCRKQYINLVPPQIIRHIVNRILEIFGADGLEGTTEEYTWLNKNYDISEEYDNIWLDLLGYYQGDLCKQPSFSDMPDDERKKILSFVKNKERHLPFLFDLARKYGASNRKFPRRLKRGATAKSTSISNLPITPFQTLHVAGQLATLRSVNEDRPSRMVALDFETAAPCDHIVEIGAVEIVGGALTGRSFHRLVRPQISIDGFAAAIHGVTDRNVERESGFADMVNEFLEFLGDAPIIAHAAYVERAVLEKELVRLGYQSLGRDRFLCTLSMARRSRLFPRNGLRDVCQALEIAVTEARSGFHDALGDAKMTAQIYLRLAKLADVADREPRGGGFPIGWQVG
jgi:DNA polymerase-3 subunit epsilon